MSNLKKNMTLEHIAYDLNEEVEDIQEIFKYLSNQNKKSALKTLKKLSTEYLNLQKKPMQQSFDFTEFYNEIKGRDLISNGKIIKDDFKLYINNCIEKENIRFDYDFEARELDSELNYGELGELATQFSEDVKRKVFEGYRAQGPGDIVYPSQITQQENKDVEEMLKEQQFKHKLDQIPDKRQNIYK